MKKILAIAPLALMLMMGGNALAAEKLNFDGEVKREYIHQKNTVEDFNKGGYRFTTLLNFQYDFDKHVSAFARVAAQTANIKHDFYTTRENGSEDTKVALDHYGLIYKNANVIYTLGQQSMGIGQQGIMFDNTGNIGHEIAGLQALKVEGSAGKVDWNTYYGQTHKTAAFDNKIVRLYGVGAKVALTDATSVGFDYAHSKSDVSKNHYALNVGHTIGKLDLELEGLRSSAANDNSAFVFSATYKPTKKDSFGISLHRTEQNADIAGMTAFENDQRGLLYKYSHTFNDRLDLGVEYMDNSYISKPGNYKAFAAAVTYRF